MGFNSAFKGLNKVSWTAREKLPVFSRTHASYAVKLRDSRHTPRHGEKACSVLWYVCSTTDTVGALRTIILDFCAVARTHRNRNNLDRNVINVCALINDSSNKTNALMLKLYFYTQTIRTPDMFRSILIIVREILNINKAYIKTWTNDYCI
jgi:hypothetical protein